MYKSNHRNIRILIVTALITMITACGSTSTNTPTEGEVVNTGSVDAEVILDNNNIIETTAEVQIGFRGSLDEDERLKAKEDAQRGMVDHFVNSRYNELMTISYAPVKQQIHENISDFILSSTIINENIDDKAKRYTLKVRAQLNEQKILDAMFPTSHGKDRTSLTFVFVARQDDAHNLPDSSRDKKAKPIYEELDDGDLSATMRSVFVTWRMYSQDAGFLSQESNRKFNPTELRDQYAQGNRVSDETIANAVRGLRSMDDAVDYLAIGAVTVDRSFNDPITGNMKVAVSVIGRVLDIKNRGSDVAAVEPKLYYGEGPTLLVARANAIKSAARQSSRIMAGQIRAYESH